MRKRREKRQVRNREMSVSEPFDEVSIAFLDAVKTKTQAVFWDQPGRYLFTALVAAGTKMA